MRVAAASPRPPLVSGWWSGCRAPEPSAVAPVGLSGPWPAGRAAGKKRIRRETRSNRENPGCWGCKMVCFEDLAGRAAREIMKKGWSQKTFIKIRVEATGKENL